MKNLLYGDGIHDDYAAIQELLDSMSCEIALPAPKVCYCISQTLKIHGGQTLRLPRMAVIRLMGGSNCCMLEDDGFESWKENICVEGGIWDYNNRQQDPNPYHFPNKDGVTYDDRLARVGIKRENGWERQLTSFLPIYSGFCMRFCRVRNLTIKNLTYRNPVCYAAQLGYIQDFVVENIFFDYTAGSPKLWNMDGIHVEGHCHNGVITNLHGACHDDLVAITADDSLYGPVSNIVVDGIFAEHCHSAVRLLSHGLPVEHIVIKNIFGSYYTYCVGLTKYHGGKEERGIMQDILIENVCASASEGTKDVAGGNYPFIWVQGGLDVKNLHIEKVAREESAFPTPTIQIDADASVDGLEITDIFLRNRTSSKMHCLCLNGNIQNDHIQNIREE